MDPTRDPTVLVQNWFNDPNNWGTSCKSDQCIDRRLLSQVNIAGKDILNLDCFVPEDEIACAAPAKYWAAIDFCYEVINRCRSMTEVPKNVEFLCMDMRNLIFPK